MPPAELRPVLNDTKWEELRAAMRGLSPRPPRYRTLAVNGHHAPEDREWVHHLRCGAPGESPYAWIRHIDILADDAAHLAAIRAALIAIHLPGAPIANGFRVLGRAAPDEAPDWIA